ncbi:glycoside hydrolase family 97 protein [Echinicola sp. 20G]|uniref:glycoside hydrolase family 97 protein n=1 Tax=Echinicola sp. 20G TaxID=2781961 RepID=UPI00191036EB
MDLFTSSERLLQVKGAKFQLSDGALSEGFKIVGISKKAASEDWETVYGEKHFIPNRYTEAIIKLEKDKDPAQNMELHCRVYDEGFAFRYSFDSVFFDKSWLKRELTRFDFDADYEAWVSEKAQSAYRKSPISEIDKACERPLVIQRNENSYLALGEAALVDFARAKFIKSSDKDYSIGLDLGSEVSLKKASYQTPWRFVMVGQSPGELLAHNYFVQNLNNPNQLEDVSWIKPGKVIREVSLTTQGGKACVDFAAEHQMQYIEFDAGWYGPEYHDESDASTITVDPNRSPGPLDLQEVIDYAKSKNVGVILYVNRRALEKQLDDILPLYKSWGIQGLKYGFVNVGTQEWTSWLHNAVRKAADHEMMVDIHDEYRPTGYSRTYPNLMTQEGIRGDEESPSVEQTLITLFTRMIAGGGDYTNCFFADRVVNDMGGKAGQMAKTILLYSPWQFLYWYDRPEGSPNKTGGAGKNDAFIEGSDALRFYDQIPTVWDDTKVLEGEIGEYATIARRNGDSWYVGSLTAGTERKVNIPLSFLSKGNVYEAEVFYQTKQDLLDNKVSIDKMEVTNETVLSRDLLANSGMGVIIHEK